MSEPTEKQVLAASLAFTGDTLEEWERSPEAYRTIILTDMRDALIAASITAVKVEHPGEYGSCCQHGLCNGGDECCCPSEQRLRNCWTQWRSEEEDADTRQAFRAGYDAGRNDPAPWKV